MVKFWSGSDAWLCSHVYQYSTKVLNIGNWRLSEGKTATAIAIARHVGTGNIFTRSGLWARDYFVSIVGVGVIISVLTYTIRGEMEYTTG